MSGRSLLPVAAVAFAVLLPNFAEATIGGIGTSLPAIRRRGGETGAKKALGSLPLGGTSSVRVAFQGEPGAYSEKACRELLGNYVQTIGKESFEDAFRAVASREVDYALLPIENSLGGSIHTVYDLLLRYNLYIIAEHTLRVRHNLLALPGTAIGDVKRVLSHPQALAQCDNYLRGRGMTPEPKYDTAGSAKYIRDEGLKDCAAIASDLAAELYGLSVLEANIEDDDVNYTRFLLLSRQPVSNLIPPDMDAKMSIVFLVESKPGMLYRAMACFALRDIDLTKCESRPTSVQLLQYLQYSHTDGPKAQSAVKAEQVRFRYCFYFDVKASEIEPNAQAAIFQLKEQSEFVRVLGSYPSNSQLIGPIVDSLNTLEALQPVPVSKVPEPEKRRLQIGIIGFGRFGQFLAKTFVKHANIIAIDKDDQTSAAHELGVEFFPFFQMSAFMRRPLDVVLLSTSIDSFDEVVRLLPQQDLRGKLVVDVLSLKEYPKQIMLDVLPQECDLLCTHPMFGPESAGKSWQSQPFVYDQVRVTDFKRVADFLTIFESERCNMIEMDAQLHDEYSAKMQFVTHLVGRVLKEQKLTNTPIDTSGFKHITRLTQIVGNDSFDLFYALFKHTENASQQIANLREAVNKVERQLAAKEAYLAARDEMKESERQRMLGDLRLLLQQNGSGFTGTSKQPQHPGISEPQQNEGH